VLLDAPAQVHGSFGGMHAPAQDGSGDQMDHDSLGGVVVEGAGSAHGVALASRNHDTPGGVSVERTYLAANVAVDLPVDEVGESDESLGWVVV